MIGIMIGISIKLTEKKTGILLIFSQEKV